MPLITLVNSTINYFWLTIIGYSTLFPQKTINKLVLGDLGSLFLHFLVIVVSFGKGIIAELDPCNR